MEVVTQAPKTSALWNLGFRPFYLLAGVFSLASIALWAAQFAGWLGHALFPDALWHAHEMIFGYAFAVIVGFLFTAACNWTGQPTPSGAALAGIAALWCAGRVFALTPWPLVAAVADAAFAIAAAAGIAKPLYASANRRNYFFVALLLAFGAANVAFYLAAQGVIDFSPRRGLQVGLDLVLLVIAVMGGRVIPMFTANAVQGSTPERRKSIETLALASVLALIAADLLGVAAGIIAAIAAIAAIAHAARLALWKPWVTVRRPILWILHASYAWLIVHFALRALAVVDVVSETFATHAFTVGTIGGLTLGMMTRTARGHTGRPLTASRTETAAYALVQLAAVVRVFMPLAVPSLYVASIVASGLLWAAAFLLFTVKFWPILVQPRIDGRAG
jgi:uncharacterized protein involved in response to NO